MKGDDVLLVNEREILLGESKFRSAPSKQAVMEASDMKDELTLPISLGFLADRLFELGYEDLSDKIFDLQIDLTKKDISIKNIGFFNF